MTLLPNTKKELEAIEAWFAELQAALGFGPAVDRGRVLAAVRKLKAEAAAYEEEKRTVAAAYGHKRWGDLYSDCLNKAGKTPEVELPAVFDEPPMGWLKGKGRSYDKAVKRLRVTRDLIKRVWAAIEEEAPEQDEGWGDEMKQEVVSAFNISTGPDSFEQECYEYLTGYEEEDPATTWVDAAELADRPLSTDSYLPTVAVFELLEHSRKAGVEVTKQAAEMYGESVWPASSWFYHLLAAYLLNNTRPTGQEKLDVSRTLDSAIAMTELVRKVKGANPAMPGLAATVWEPSVSLTQLKAAYETYLAMEAKGDDVTTTEMEVAIREALMEAQASSN